MRYRRQALRRLEAPEQLDRVVRLARAPSWLVAAALVAVVVVAVAWAVIGTVARTVNAGGVLIHANGVSGLDATVAGQVLKVWTGPNQLVTSHSPLYTVEAEDGTVTTVKSPWDAYVVRLFLTQGQLVERGTSIADLERVDQPGDALTAAVFVSATSAPMLRAGTVASVSASSAPSAVFGTLSGTIQSVGSFPETADTLKAFLGADVDPSPYLEHGSVIRVVIRLRTDAASVTGLRWTKSSPPFVLPSETAVSARFTVAEEHPISWLVG